MLIELKKHKEPFAEFVEWVKKQDYYEWSYARNSLVITERDYQSFEPNGLSVSDYELQGLLIEFLDFKGVYVLPYLDVTESDKMWLMFDCDIKNKSNNHLTIESVRAKTRTEATEQGIIKAFEILENKFKE